MVKNSMVIILIMGFWSSYAQFSKDCACKAVVDTNYRGDLTILKSPLRPESTSVRHDLNKKDFMGLSLKRDSAGYFFVTISHALNKTDSVTGWIKKWEYVGVYAKQANGEDALRLYAQPDRNSPVGAIIPEWCGTFFKVERCSGKWMFVRTQTKGREFSGWLSPDWQCANSRASCK